MPQDPSYWLFAMKWVYFSRICNYGQFCPSPFFLRFLSLSLTGRGHCSTSSSGSTQLYSFQNHFVSTPPSLDQAHSLHYSFHPITDPMGKKGILTSIFSRFAPLPTAVVAVIIMPEPINHLLPWGRQALHDGCWWRHMQLPCHQDALPTSLSPTSTRRRCWMTASWRRPRLRSGQRPTTLPGRPPTASSST